MKKIVLSLCVLLVLCSCSSKDAVQIAKKSYDLIIKLPNGEVICSKGTYHTLSYGVVVAELDDGRIIRVHSINFLAIISGETE